MCHFIHSKQSCNRPQCLSFITEVPCKCIFTYFHMRNNYHLNRAKADVIKLLCRWCLRINPKFFGVRMCRNYKHFKIVQKAPLWSLLSCYFKMNAKEANSVTKQVSLLITISFSSSGNIEQILKVAVLNPKFFNQRLLARRHSSGREAASNVTPCYPGYLKINWGPPQ